MLDLRPLLLSFGIATLGILRAGDALACGALPCGQLNDALPQDGSVGVPLNTEIRILYFGVLPPVPESIIAKPAGPVCDIDLARLRLSPQEGEPIELSGSLQETAAAAETWVVAKPSAPLAANTTYAVQLELGGGVEVCSCSERAWTTVSTFTTGTAADNVAPAFDGVSALSFGQRADSSNDCGESKLIPTTLAFTPASDLSLGLRYNLYVDGSIERRYVGLTGGETPEIYVDCGTGALTTATLVAPGARLEVRAVDVAGNESAANAPVDVTATCEPGRDAAAAGDPVATDGPDPRIDVIATPTSSSCAFSPPGAGMGSGAALAALLAALAGRGSRRRGSR